MQGLWSYISKTGQGPGKDFQYEIGEVVTKEMKSPWTLHNGKKKGTGDQVSIFVCESKDSTPDELQLAKMAHKRLKTLRHPNIIKYLDGFESETMVYVVTEFVTPLAMVLSENDTRDSNLISWGIHQITIGLSFMINDGNLIHGNVNIYSIFVGIDGEWKLGGLEYVRPVNNDPVAKISSLTRYDPPEGSSNRKQEKWSVDAWGLGCLIWEIYNEPLPSSSSLKNVSKIPKPVVVHYCELVCANPKSRTNPKDFLNNAKKAGQFLNNPFIMANIFLQEIQLKDVKAQKEFFNLLDTTIDGFPKEFCIHKVLPQLLNAYEYGTAGSSVLSPLFKIGLLLDDNSYQKKILPCIIKLFSSNDRSTRIHLLQQMEKFVKHLQPAVVNNQIFPCVASGFADTLPAMREQTVKAMLMLAPKLTEKTLDQLLRHFAKLQMDEQAGIRTNTTICLGKIAQYLPEQTRKKMLIPAFARALRDPFPPARSAGVMAMVATQQYHNIRDVAARILPVLAPLTTDPEKMVRDNTFKVIKSFLSNLEDFSTNPDSPLNNEEAAAKEATAESGASWTGWAVSSFTSRFYQSSSTDQSKQENTSAKPPSSTNNKTTSKPLENTKERLDSTTKPTKSEKPAKDNFASDGWDNDFDDDDDFKSIDSMKEDLMDVRKEMNSYKNTDNTNNGDKSDSDYDDWQDDGWANNDKNDVLTNDKKKDGRTNDIKNDKWKNNDNEENTWNDMAGDGWDFNERKPIETKPKPSVKSEQVRTPGTWDDWGAADNNDTDDSWLPKTESKNGDGWGEADTIGGDSGGWDEGWPGNGEDEEKVKKEKKKLELQRKREERKAQRELNNKNKREKSSSSTGAMKLGTVKKKGPSS